MSTKTKLLFTIILIFGNIIPTNFVMGHEPVSAAILGEWVDTADGVTSANIELTARYGSAYLTFKVVISGEYGVAAGAASGYSIAHLSNGKVAVSPKYLLQVKAKELDGPEKDVRYYKTYYWKKKVMERTDYGYRVNAVAYVKVVRKIIHSLWKDYTEVVIYNPNVDVGGRIYIHE
ncbi:hypothetical protein P8X24_03095 [Pyrococcus kukulkanii]|uniref:hypothetical protein n=1 Tax=Pyrococcus kukulkanii TaxID=1609559 RepID=UPI00356AEBBC